MNEGYTKCGRKLALSVFFCTEVLALTICLVSILSPSWQWVALENGRTEHHHGLWLDCKRDYSYDYGRTREYYETLYRRDMQGSPFDVFYLPKLECIYKFDYYIDPEDLYDHNYDENRLWDDAYQHLWLGHKIAAVAACGVSLIFSAIALLLCICAFCHRTFIAAATSIITLASILSFAGLAVFYGWSVTQDNSLVKQQDEKETYEQILGWAFYAQLIGALLHLFAAALGCFATSVAFSKKRAKLVRIDVMESAPSSSQANLLSMNELGDSGTAPFKRSFSAVYRVDSSALQQWEKDYAKHIEREKDQFVRTKSMPMLGRKRDMSKRKKKSHAKALSERRSSSTLFLSSMETGENSTGTTNTLESDTSNNRPQRRPPSIPTPQPPKQLKSAMKTPQSQRRFASTYELNANQGSDNPLDSTYEYLPCERNPKPIGTGFSTFITERNQPSSSSVYDSVYDAEPTDLYLEPNSQVASRSASILNIKGAGESPSRTTTTLPVETVLPVETLIDDIAQPSTSSDRHDEVRDVEFDTHTRIRELQTIEELQRVERMRRTRPQLSTNPSSSFLPPSTSSKSPVTGGFSYTAVGLLKSTLLDRTARARSSNMESPGPSSIRRPPDPPKKPASKQSIRDFALPTTSSVGYCEEVQSLRGDSERGSPPRELCLNTFGASDVRGSTRSLTSLKFRHGADTSGSAAEIFERPDSAVLEQPPDGSRVSSASSNASSRRGPSAPQHSLHKKLLLGTVPDEVDRSVGSSTCMENDTMTQTSSSSNYAKDAELRLNLFLNEVSPLTSRHNGRSRDDETTV